MRYPIRPATLADKPQLEALIARSARELSAGLYTPEQVEGALRGAFGVDTQLIVDGTYFVVEDAGKPIACGGWSKRRTLFGSDARTQRDASELDPRVDAAKIRAFFVDAAYARRGIGTALLDHCESAARAHGYTRFELMATLPGVPLYTVAGYIPDPMLDYPLNGPLDGATAGASALSIQFVPMKKTIA
jgi:GNAT superfamily N-acetyltransferase